MLAATSGSTFLTALAGGLLGGTATVVATVLTLSHQRRDRYDTALLTRRMAAYEALMSRLEPLAFARRTPPSATELQATGDKITQWYYKGGHGLYLTRARTTQVFALRDALVDLNPDVALPEGTLPMLLDKASALRTQLTRDIGSRRVPLLENQEGV